MRSIESLIRQGLAEFLSQSERAHFQGDHADDVLQLLVAEQWTGGDQWKPAFECFADYGLVSELGQFVDEFRLWSRQVADIRGEWLYDHSEIELPSDYLSVFGHTSQVAQQLDPLLNRCRRIVRRIDELHASKPEPPQAEPMRVSVTEDGLAFMQAAQQLGAFGGVALASSEIAQKAFGRGSIVARSLLASLKDQGLTDPKQGKGLTLTPKAIEFLRQRT